jgi:p-aminobenzoyl-glutamate transporter AbgT
MITRKDVYDKLTILPLLLFVVWIGVILYSWIANAAGYNVESLLSPDGIRWSFSHAIGTDESLGLMYVVLFILAVGVVKDSHIIPCIISFFHYKNKTDRLSFRQRHGLMISLTLFAIWTIVLLCCVFMPHALLLNVTGKFFPSPYINGLILSICYNILFTCLTFASLSGNIRSWNDCLNLFCCGIHDYAWIILSYLLAAQIWNSFSYINVN